MGMETLLVANEDKVRWPLSRPVLSLQTFLVLFAPFWSLILWAGLCPSGH